jgi:hypothetical protein
MTFTGIPVFSDPITGHIMNGPPKIKWQELPGNKLQAYAEVGSRGFERGLRDSDMEPIQEWCEAHQCGRRMSFNLFYFKNKAEISMFLLRWT